MKSILQTEKECFFCRTTEGLECHHCIGGNANRKIADKVGAWVWLCKRHHTGAEGVHGKRSDLKKMLQKEAQRAFEKDHTREEWMELFGRNYLWDEE